VRDRRRAVFPAGLFGGAHFLFFILGAATAVADPVEPPRRFGPCFRADLGPAYLFWTSREGGSAHAFGFELGAVAGLELGGRLCIGLGPGLELLPILLSHHQIRSNAGESQGFAWQWLDLDVRAEAWYRFAGPGLHLLLGLGPAFQLSFGDRGFAARVGIRKDTRAGRADLGFGLDLTYQRWFAGESSDTLLVTLAVTLICPRGPRSEEGTSAGPPPGDRGADEPASSRRLRDEPR
jgi:hypothetical protein